MKCIILKSTLYTYYYVLVDNFFLLMMCDVIIINMIQLNLFYSRMIRNGEVDYIPDTFLFRACSMK